MRKLHFLFFITLFTVLFVKNSWADSIDAEQNSTEIFEQCFVNNAVVSGVDTVPGCTDAFYDSRGGSFWADIYWSRFSSNQYRLRYNYEGTTGEISGVFYSYSTQIEYLCPDPAYPDLWSMNGSYFCSEPFRISPESEATVLLTNEEVNTIVNDAVPIIQDVNIDNSVINNNYDNSVTSASQAAAADSYSTVTNTTIQNTYSDSVTNQMTNNISNETIQVLADAAASSQTAADAATVAAAEALANATDAQVAAITAAQASADAAAADSAIATAAAQQAAAQAAAYAAESQDAVDAAIVTAQAAVAAAESAMSDLVAASDALNNDLLQSSNDAAQSAAEAAAAAWAAAGQSSELANLINQALANGTFCIGDSCSVIPDFDVDGDGDGEGEGEGDGEGEEELTLNTEPSGESFVESQYPDGVSGVMNDAIDLFKAGSFYAGMSDFIVSAGSGSVPEWNMCFDSGMGVNLGCHSLSVPAYVWDFIKIIMIVMAGFLCRAIVMGG